MRTRITALCVSLLLAGVLLAQDDDTEKSNGIRGGFHMSDLVGEDDLDTRSGFYFGYYRNWFKIPLLSVSGGLEVNTAGAKADDVDSEFRLTYLTLPINGRLKLGPFYADLGIDAAVKVNEKFLIGGEEFEIIDENEGETFDVLAHVGAGFKFLFLGVEARYRYALTEVYANNGYRNTGLQVGLITFF